MTGQRERELKNSVQISDKIRFNIQDEFFYQRSTDIEEIYTSFYEKNDLKAEIVFGETTYVTISRK